MSGVQTLSALLQPEVALGTAAAQAAPTLAMGAIIVLALLILVIGVITYSSMTSSKVPGSVLILVGLLMGGGAFYTINR